MDPKRKLIQLTDMCFPFSKQQANMSNVYSSADAAYRAATPPMATFPPTGASFGQVFDSVDL